MSYDGMKGRNLNDMTHKPMYQISFYYPCSTQGGVYSSFTSVRSKI